MRALLLLGVALGACGVTDDRPQTLAYITETILKPSCGTANCHAERKNLNGYAFDTVEASLNAMAGIGETTAGPLLVPCTDLPCDPKLSYLFQVIDHEDVFGNRMPLDQPLANKDIDFIATWIENGSPGVPQMAAP